MQVHRRRILPFIALALLGAVLIPPAHAATSRAAAFYPAVLFGNAGTENVTRVLGNPGKPEYTVLGTTTGALPGKTSGGGIDAFIRRYSHTGQATRQYGTAGDDVPYGEYGSVEVGSTTGALPGHTNAGGTDGFVWAFKSGITAWATRLGTGGEDKVVAIAPGAGGSLFVVGTTTGTFGGETNHGGIDYFVAKLASNGDVKYVDQLGTAGDDRAVSISVSYGYVGDCCGYENIVTVSGDTTGTFPDQTALGGRDLFTVTTGAEFDPGSLHQFGTSGDDVAIAGSGAAIAGSTTGAFPGQTNRGGTDAFVARAEWAYEFGTSADDRATAVARSNTSEAIPYQFGYLVAGDTDGVLPGKASHGGSDAFALRVDDGTLRWRTQFGSPGNDHAGGIASTSRGAIYAGQANGELDGQPARGGGDGFIGRATWVRPDVAVDYYSSGPRPTGANIFGGPTIPFYIGGTARKGWVNAYNDGEQTDDRRFVGCRSTTVFNVRFYNGVTGRDVTAAVQAGTYQDSGPTRTYQDLTFRIGPKPGVKPGSTSYCTIKVYSTRNPAVYDDVTLRVVR